MKSIFRKNASILENKYPAVSFFIDKNPLAKNFGFNNILSIEIDLNNIDTLYVYKLIDYVPDNIFKWLENKNNKLIFIEDDLDSIHRFLHLTHATKVLNKQNIHIHYLLNEFQLLEEIGHKYPTNQLKFVTFYKKDKKFEYLKYEVIKRSLISFYLVYDVLFSYKHFKNFSSNIKKIKGSFYVNNLKDSFKDIPAIICGAGPSLKYSFETLKKLNNKTLIIAVGSAITCLTRANIFPHLGIIIDPNLDEYKRMKDAFFYEGPIIYSTRVNKGVFHAFNGPRGYIKAAIGRMFEIWMDEKLEINKTYLSNELDDRALSVSSIGISLANFLGCGPIILDGFDLAYSENQLYSADIKENTVRDDELGNLPVSAKDKNNLPVFTNLKWQIEEELISSYVTNYADDKFLNATQGGMKIRNIKDISIKNIEKQYLKKQFDIKGLLHSLIQKNMLKVEEGEVQDFEKELISSLKKSKFHIENIINADAEYKKILNFEELKDEFFYKYIILELKHTLDRIYLSEDRSWIKIHEFLNNLYIQ